jgi:hypothetical protein
MKIPCYIDLEQAQIVLAEMGVNLTLRQIKRAADPDIHGRRKLPFFVDPIERKLRIEKGSLVKAYMKLQSEAENNCKINDDMIQ